MNIGASQMCVLTARVVLIMLAAAALGPTTLGAPQTESAAPALRLAEAEVAALNRRLGGLSAGTRAALVVADAATGQTLYARNGDELLKPASVQKLFTTAAALQHFPPDFAFQTQLFLVGEDLWVIGGGDPALGDPRLAARDDLPLDHVLAGWADALRDAGVQSVHRLVLDDSIFDEQHRHPDWPDSQSDRWYQAPVGGLNFNNNCVDVTLSVAGSRVLARLTPELPDNWLENRAQVGKQQRPVLRRQPHRDVVELAGTVVRGGALDPVSVYRPTIFFGHVLRSGLTRHGVPVTGPITPRTPDLGQPAGARLVAVHRTPLADVVWRCNTFSQNMFAEALFKALAAYGSDGRRTGVSASWDTGREVLLREMATLGVSMDGARVRDGSGLSHSNRVSAATIVRLLVAMRGHARWPVFEASLARAGELGSMNRRYGRDGLRGRLVGKTGTLRDVSALAGYATRTDGSVLAFAVLINGEAPADLTLRICETLVGGE